MKGKKKKLRANKKVKIMPQKEEFVIKRENLRREETCPLQRTKKKERVSKTRTRKSTKYPISLE